MSLVVRASELCAAHGLDAEADMRLMGRAAYTGPSLLRRECVKGALRRRQIAGAVAVSLAFVLVAGGLGCGSDHLSPLSNENTPTIEEIKEALAMAEHLEKVDQDVLDWYQEHPGESRRLRLILDVNKNDMNLERETSPHSSERRTLNHRKTQMLDAGGSRGEVLSVVRSEEMQRIVQRLDELHDLIEEDKRAIRERNRRRYDGGYKAVWTPVLEKLRRIEEVEIEIQIPDFPFLWTVVAPASALAEIAAIPEVLRIEHTGWTKPAIDVSRAVIGADYVQGTLNVKGSGVLVAVIDSGIHAGPCGDEHPSMVGTPSAANRQDFSNSGSVWDNTNHGTLVAGIIRAVKEENEIDYVGMAPECDLINAKFYDTLAGGDPEDTKAAINWAVDTLETGADVVNVSTATDNVPGDGTTNSERSYDWFTYGNPQVVLCTAVGNEGVNSGGEEDQIPEAGGAYNTLVVAAFDDHRSTDPEDYTRVSYDAPIGPIRTSGRRKPDLSAPGQASDTSDPGIWSARVYQDPEDVPASLVNDMANDDVYRGAFTGSSFATPHVAGAAALIKDVLEDSTNIAVKAILINSAHSPRAKQLQPNRSGWMSARDNGLLGSRTLGVWDEMYGWGQLDARNAVLTAMSASEQLDESEIGRGDTDTRTIDPDVAQATVGSVTVCWRRKADGFLVSPDTYPVSHIDLQVKDDTTGVFVAHDLTDNSDNVKKVNFTARPNRTYTIYVIRDENDPEEADEPYALVSSFDFAS